MKLRIFFTLFLLVFASVLFGQGSKPGFSREKFYSAISSDDLKLVDAQLKLLDKETIEEKEGYSGALLMKKAGLVKNLKNKLSLFKSGHKMLEEAIKKDSSNTEYRFLRLIIQENAPDILNYNKELKEDSTFIVGNYKTLPTEVKNAVEDYSKKSKVLKLK